MAWPPLPLTLAIMLVYPCNQHANHHYVVAVKVRMNFGHCNVDITV